MTKFKFKKTSLYFSIMVFINILLFVSVFLLMNHVQFLLNSDVKNNLTEIVTQNKDAITSKLMLELNNMELIAKHISEDCAKEEEINEDTLGIVFSNYMSENYTTGLYIASEKGKAVFADGKEEDISGRNYFRWAMEGKSNISERTISRINGEDIFVISVPINYNEEIIGTLQRQYSPQEIYNLCSVSLFSEQGYMYIINSEGYILISSKQDKYSNESDNYFRMIFQNNPEGAKVLQEDIQNNKAGFIEMNIDGQKVFSAYTPIDQIFDWYLISSVATDVVSANGNAVIKLFYFVLTIVAVIFASSMIYFFYLKNKQQNKLKKIAFVDAITQGDTYTKFEIQLQETLTQDPCGNYFIFAFDIDNFKFINSFYGFEAGDRVLRKIYAIYKQKMLSDELIARVTGDRFVAMLSEASEERLNKLFEPEMNIEGIKVYLSAGVYPIAGIDESISLMVDKANIAKQKIKGMRYKRVEIYSESYDKQMMESEQIKRAVEMALINNEIVPYFQPKVDISTRELTGAEALARWQSGDGKLIQPCDFIPVCEQTGLIVKVDMTIFEKTLQFISKNLKQGIHCVPISVNFSRMHLFNSDFLKNVLNKLKEYEVPAELIELELTETVIFDNYNQAADFIKELHESGLKISMDDFGSGYSSLHMLKDVDIDILKIDREFLRETANSEKQKIIFGTIVDLARKLDIKVVVEGVEFKENIELMKEYGCLIAQGYYYSKPIDWIEFEKYYCEGKL